MGNLKNGLVLAGFVVLAFIGFLVIAAATGGERFLYEVGPDGERKVDRYAGERGVASDGVERGEETPAGRHEVEAPTAGATDELGALRVTVRTGPAGAETPAGGVAVEIVPRAERRSPWQRVRVTADGNGVAVLGGLAPGAYRITASGGLPGFADAEVAAGATASAFLDLRETLTFGGSVVDVQGAPIGQAIVEVIRLGRGAVWERVAVTGADGRFRIEHAPTMGLLRARKRGYECSAMSRLVMDQTSSDSMVFTLRAGGGVVTGRVLLPSGGPADGALVQVGESSTGVVLESDRAGQRVRVGADGRFEVVGLETGTYRVAAKLAGFATWEGECEVLTGAISQVTAPLVSGGSCFGKAVAADGTPITGILVRRIASKNLIPDVVSSAEDGSFQLADLPLGNVRLEAGNRSVGFVTTELFLRSGDAVEWNLEFPEPTALYGRVVSKRTGVGVKRTLSLLAEEGPDGAKPLIQEVVPDDEGYFSVDGLSKLRVYHLAIQDGVRETVVVRDLVPGGKEIVVEVEPVSARTGR